MTEHHLYYSAGDIRKALDDLGPPATLSEGTIFSAATTLAELIEDSCVWTVEIERDSATARQHGEPHVRLIWTDL